MNAHPQIGGPESPPEPDEVEQHKGDIPMLGRFEDLQGLLAGAGGLSPEAQALDGLFENATLGRVVVDDK